MLMDGSFLIVLVHSLLSFGIEREQIKQAILVVATLVSARLGSPMVTLLKSDRPEMIPNFVRLCLKAIPSDWYLDASKNKDFTPEFLDGKTVVDMRGLVSAANLDMINGCYLDPNREYNIGYLGVIHDGDQ